MPSFGPPVASWRGVSTFSAHMNRNPRSSEPGADFYCDTGTPLLSLADGQIAGRGGSIYPATGRWTGINFDNGWSARYLHASAWESSLWDRVRGGQSFGWSGASGYGSEFFGEPYRNDAFWRDTGGDHVHLTVWPWHNGWNSPGVGNVDPQKYITVDGLAGGNYTIKEWDDMASREDIKIAMREVGTEGGNGAFVVSYSAPEGNGRNGIVLAGLGFWHGFTGEEFQHVYQWDPKGQGGLYKNLPVITPVNDRHYDLLKNVCTLNAAGIPASVDVPALASALSLVDRDLDTDELRKVVEGVVAANVSKIADAVNDDAAARLAG